MKIQHAIIGVLLMATALTAADSITSRRRPKEGFVPDATTAIKIGVAVCEPILGTNRLDRMRPFTARLTNDVWVVEGSMSRPMSGRVLLVEVAKEDARIVRVYGLGASREF